MGKASLAMIVNPNAGRKFGSRVAKKVESKLLESGLTVEIFYSSYPGESLSIAKSLNQHDWAGVIAVGGDGTLFEVINGLSLGNSEIIIPVGQIPVGSGNSYLRDLDIVSIDDAVKPIISGSFRQVDLGFFSCDAGSFRFINLIGAGFVSNVARRAEKYKIFGSRGYLLGVFEEIIRLEPTPIQMMVDDEIVERNAVFVEICNARFTGGNMLMAPSAEIDDGLLDIVIMKATSRLRALTILPKLFAGNHIHTPEIEVFRGKKIKLESERPMALTPDGETFGYTPLEVGIEHKGLTFYG